MTKENHILKSFENYLKSRGKSRATLVGYTCNVGLILKHLNKEPENITLKDIEKWRSYWDEQVKQGETKPNAMCIRCNAFRVFLRYLKANKINNIIDEIDKNENRALLTPPPHKKVKREVLTDDIIERLFLASKNNLCHHSMMKLFFAIPQRKSSIVHLNDEDIDWNGKVEDNGTKYYECKIINPKGEENGEFTVTLFQDTIDSLNEYRRIRPQPAEGCKNARSKGEYTDNWGRKLYHKDSLFLNDLGYRFQPNSVNYIMTKYERQLGLPRGSVFPQLWRHSGATRLDASGMSLKEIALQTGHRNTKTLEEVYIQPKMDTNIRAKINKALTLNNKTPETPKPQEPSKPTQEQEQLKQQQEQITQLQTTIKNLQTQLQEPKTQSMQQQPSDISLYLLKKIEKLEEQVKEQRKPLITPTT
ncbi:MAG: tyrosine-type recombinase/integrase [Euryarchaeota archaeon]|nr:tyrosine-type recombinase/integrase [Euryarchaeota archaeon]